MTWLPSTAVLGDLAGAWVPLDEHAAAHARVLRLGDGAEVTLFDGRGRHAAAALQAHDARPGALLCADPTLAPEPRFTLVQAVPKGDKLDDIVRMATEIGVRAIHLALTERCVARPTGERQGKQIARLTRIAWSAAAQAEQAWVPQIEPPAPLDEVTARAPATALRLLAAPRTGASLAGLRDADFARHTWLVVGPEGGLSPEEERTLDRLGWRAVALPTGILRTETAAAVLLGALVARAASEAAGSATR